MSKHTPGPWKARPQEGLRAVLIESQDEACKNQAAVATVWTGGFYGPANSQIIAAAPDLLRLLDEFRNATKHIALKHFKHSVDHRYFSDVYEEASELIASLGGERIIGGGS